MDKVIPDDDVLLQDNGLGALIDYLKVIVRKIEKRVGKIFDEHLLQDATLDEHIQELKKYLDGVAAESNTSESQTGNASGAEKDLDEQISSLRSSFIYVKGFYRKDGRFVKPHYRNRRKKAKGKA